MHSQIDSRVVRAVRNLKRMNTIDSNSDVSSTRESTPASEMQILDVIANRDDLKGLLERYGVDPEVFYHEVKEDLMIVRNIMMEPDLSLESVKRIEEKLEEYTGKKQVETAKSSMQEKIRQRIAMLQQRLTIDN